MEATKGDKSVSNLGYKLNYGIITAGRYFIYSTFAFVITQSVFLH